MIALGALVCSLVVVAVNAAGKCDDVAIIGGGLAGTYMAYKMRDEGLQVMVYEYTDRVGGKARTLSFPTAPGVPIDMGPMRSSVTWDERLLKTVDELGLETTPFEYSYDELPDVYYLRGEHVNREDLASSAPYDVRNIATDRSPAQALHWKVIEDHVNYVEGTVDTGSFSTLRESLKSDDDVLLSDQTILGLFSKYLSTEELQMVKDVYEFDYIGHFPADSNVVLSEPPRYRPGRVDEQVTLVKGYENLAQEMLLTFLNASDNHGIQYGRRLDSIRKTKKGQYQLKFVNTRTRDGVTTITTKKSKGCADKVVLAVPLIALQNIKWDATAAGPVGKALNEALYPMESLKMYLAFDTQWWNDSPVGDYIVSSTPLKQTYVHDKSYRSSGGSGNVLLVSYSDIVDDMALWKEMLSQGSPYPGSDDDKTFQVTDVAVDYAMKYLSEVFDVRLRDIPAPTHAAGKLWANDDVIIDGAWYYWRAGYNITALSEQMLKPDPAQEVYIASAVWNTDYYSWESEAAFQNVESVLELMGLASVLEQMGH